MLVLNLKAYAQSAGPKAVSLANAARSFSEKSRKKVVLCPSAFDLASCSKGVSKNYSVFAQHVDALEPGQFTGGLTVEGAIAAGASGTLLNHNEKQVSFEHARLVIQKSDKLKFKTVICANTVEKAVLFAQLRPWAIAVEIPELIGTGVSISRVRPEVVENAVRQIKIVSEKILVFAGAGVADANDYYKAMDLGVEGVLVSSRFVNAPNAKEWLAEFAKRPK